MMKMRLIILVLAGLSLAGCGPGTKLNDFAQTIKAVTATVINPVTPLNLYQAEIAFAGSQEVVKKYQQDCFGSNLPPYPVSFAIIETDPVLSVQCAHRVSRFNAMKVAEDRAFRAISAANIFIKQNPSGNAASYIAAAVRAVTDYRTAAGG